MKTITSGCWEHVAGDQYRCRWLLSCEPGPEDRSFAGVVAGYLGGAGYLFEDFYATFDEGWQLTSLHIDGVERVSGAETDSDCAEDLDLAKHHDHCWEWNDEELFTEEDRLHLRLDALHKLRRAAGVYTNHQSSDTYLVRKILEKTGVTAAPKITDRTPLPGETVEAVASPEPQEKGDTRVNLAELEGPNEWFLDGLRDLEIFAMGFGDESAVGGSGATIKTVDRSASPDPDVPDYEQIKQSWTLSIPGIAEAQLEARFQVDHDGSVEDINAFYWSDDEGNQVPSEHSEFYEICDALEIEMDD